MYPELPALNYPWQRLILEVLMELDPESLQSKINKAEDPIRERLLGPNPTLHEQTVLHDSLRVLQLRSLKSRTSRNPGK
jgi:hypothetical protein